MTDQQIVALFFARSEDAISALRQKYGKLCRHVAMNIVKNESDAEECESDTYLRVWDTVPPTDPDPLSPYVLRITRNLALDRYRYNRAARRFGGGDALLSEVEDVLTTSDGAESEAMRAELSRCISDFLRTLRAEDRKLFVRRYWYGEDMSALADLFGISENSAAVKLFRVRQKMKSYLEKEGFSL